MSTRDIIEAAHKPDADLLMLHPCPCQSDCPCDKLEAWATVDKKLALMEAVCKEAGTGHTWSAGCELCDALDALAAWRRKHGDE